MFYKLAVQTLWANKILYSAKDTDSSIFMSFMTPTSKTEWYSEEHFFRNHITVLTYEAGMIILENYNILMNILSFLLKLLVSI